MDIDGKVIIITGSSMGIGREAALILSGKGAKVVVISHNSVKEGKEVADECGKNSDSLYIKADVTNDSDIRSIIQKTLKKFGKIDALVNNAGIVKWKAFSSHSFKDIQDLTDTNLSSMIKLTLEALPHLKKQNEAVIVNIASGAGKEAFKELVPYCATKFGVRGFTQGLALELPKNVRTYVVNPGMTATRMTGFKGDSPKKVAEIIIKALEEKLGKKSGEDIDIWDYI